MDVLEYLFPVSDLSRRKIMNFKLEVCHSSFAHLLLMGDTCNSKKSRLLLSNRERRNFGLLRVRFAINVITKNKSMRTAAHRKEEKRDKKPDCPRGYAFKLELGYFSHTYIFTSFKRNNSRSLCNIYPDRTQQRVQSCLFAI